MPRLAVLASIFVCGIGRLAYAQPDPVLTANMAAIDAIRAASTPPPVAARALAILHASIYDAVNGITRSHEPFVVRSTGPASASVQAAAVAAAHRALVDLFPDQEVTFDRLQRTWLSSIAEGPYKARGIAWGESVADAIIAWRANDGADILTAAPASSGPGSWVPTAPSFAPYLLPQWGSLMPFAMPGNATFRPAGPPSLLSAEWVADFNEVKAYGAAVGSLRGGEQDAVALFWADGPGTETPPGHWNAIARTVAVAAGNSLEDNARLFGLLNVAMADAGICAWDAKYAFDFWRPITAIRLGDSDGNPSTIAEPGWTPLLVTPPFPEYVSGHSTFSGAAARVLAMFYGSDSIPFVAYSDALPNSPRAFRSFAVAAAEAALSRLYGGIHFRSAIQDGLIAGVQIGQWTVMHTMQPREHRSRR